MYRLVRWNQATASIHYSYIYVPILEVDHSFLFLVLGWPISDESLSGVDGHLEAFPHLLHQAMTATAMLTYHN